MIKEQLEFETGKEFHHDTGEVWEGYIVLIKPAYAEPGACLVCEEWFIKGQQVHEVFFRWCCGDPDGHWIEKQRHGFVCSKCFELAKSTKQFLRGKLR